MKTLTLLLLVLLPTLASAQGTAKLDGYLASHRYAVNIERDRTLTIPKETSLFIKQMMKGKSLFVLGESTRGHKWKFYNVIRPALVKQFCTMKLKDFFVEWGRGTAYLFNQCKVGKFSSDTMGRYIWRGYGDELGRVAAIAKLSPPFRYVGIDFEWRATFHLAINNLLLGVDTNQLKHSRPFISELEGDAYRNFSFKEFRKFYRRIRRDFCNYDTAIKKEVPAQYEVIKYFCTNHNNVSPSMDRNPAMYRNLVQEITPIDTDATYLLSIGGAHTTAGNVSVLHKLKKNASLHDRIVTMNVLCVDGTANANPFFHRLKGAILASFVGAGRDGVTIFDLSQLPSEYAWLQRYGDLLLFVKNAY